MAKAFASLEIIRDFESFWDVVWVPECGPDPLYFLWAPGAPLAVPLCTGQSDKVIFNNLGDQILSSAATVVIFFSPYNPPTPLPRQTPRPSHPEKLDFGPFRLRFGSVWLRFGSVSGPFRGVGWGRGGVG